MRLKCSNTELLFIYAEVASMGISAKCCQFSHILSQSVTITYQSIN